MFIRTSQFSISSEGLINVIRVIPHYKTQRRLTFFIIGGPMIAALFGMLSREIRQGDEAEIGSTIVAWLIPVSIMVVVIGVGSFIKNKLGLQKLQKTGAFDIFHIVEFDDEKVLWHTNKGQSDKTYWRDYEKVIKTLEFYVLIKNKSNFQWIPLSAFTSSENVYTLDGFLLEKRLLKDITKQTRST